MRRNINLKIYNLFNCGELFLDLTQITENGLKNELKDVPIISSLEKTADTLNRRRKVIFDMSVNDIIGILNEIGVLWSNPDFEPRKALKQIFLQTGQFSEEMVDLSFTYMVNMYNREYLEQILDYDLMGNREVLDDFIRLYDKTPINIRAVPRGIAGHWISGNTLVIGQISLLRTILTKNANIIKVSSKNKIFLPIFLDSFKYVNYQNDKGISINGSVLASCTSVIYFDSSDKECNKELSKCVNIRIARGGRKAIHAIMNTKKEYGTEDVIYGPKYSMIAIGRECLSYKKINTLVKNIAIDFSIWDQYACTSPHVIFAEKNGEISVEELAKKISEQMELLEKILPNESVNNDNAPAIVAARIENELNGITYCKPNTSWSVLFNEEISELPKPLFSRVVRVVAIDDISRIYGLIDKYVQTVGVAMEEGKKKRFINECTYRGVERCVPVGLMHTMLPGSPWDGFFNCDRMVRWVSYFDSRKGTINEDLIIDF